MYLAGNLVWSTTDCFLVLWKYHDIVKLGLAELFIISDDIFFTVVLYFLNKILYFFQAQIVKAIQDKAKSGDLQVTQAAAAKPGNKLMNLIVGW